MREIVVNASLPGCPFDAFRSYVDKTAAGTNSWVWRLVSRLHVTWAERPIVKFTVQYPRNPRSNATVSPLYDFVSRMKILPM